MINRIAHGTGTGYDRIDDLLTPYRKQSGRPTQAATPDSGPPENQGQPYLRRSMQLYFQDDADHLSTLKNVCDNSLPAWESRGYWSAPGSDVVFIAKGNGLLEGNTDQSRAPFSVGPGGTATDSSRKQTGGQFRRGGINRLTHEERQQIQNILIDDPNKSTTDLAYEYRVARRSIQRIKQQLRKGGKIAADPSRTHSEDQSGLRGNRRLTLEERQHIQNVLINDPNCDIASLARDLNVSLRALRKIVRQFREHGNTASKLTTHRLTHEQRLQLRHIFINEPNRSSYDIASDFGVCRTSIRDLRTRFEQSGSINPGMVQLTDAMKQQMQTIFINEPNRSTSSIARDFQVPREIIFSPRKQFKKSLDMQPGPGGHEPDDQSGAHLSRPEPDSIESLRELSRFMEQADPPIIGELSAQASVAYHELEAILKPDDASCWLNLGQAHKEAGNFEAAQRALAKARQVAGG